jgi:hypothetical protein
VRRNVSAAVLVAAALVALATSVEATAIIMLRNNNRIVLAADSRWSDQTAGSMGITKRHGCKIHRSGQFWFMTSGYEGGGDQKLGGPGVDSVIALVAERLKSARTLADALQSVGRAWDTMRPKVEGLVAHPALQHLLRPSALGPFMQVVLAGQERGVPTVGVFTVRIQSARPVQFSTRAASCPGTLCPGPDGFALYGASKAGAMAPLVSNPPAWLRAVDSTAARQVIDLEIAASPTFVGPPVDILVIDAGGARWVNRDPKSACPAIH